MTKLICKTFGSLLANKYRTPSGNEYLFRRGIPTNVKNKADVEYFLRSGNYEKAGAVAKAVKAVKVAVGIPVESTEVKALTKVEIYDLNKKEQRVLIKKLGGMNARVPTLEKDRVKEILRLQGNEEKEVTE
ncbi:hypothetical protein IIA15_01105 [candidate division TA06 bacterium]|nr:hypothetical protein [candidate division TA06 bacterium]